MDPLNLFGLADGPPWQDDAACATVDPTPFLHGDEALAVAICALCPVRQECVDYALVNDERIGVWGGLTEPQRRTWLPT